MLGICISSINKILSSQIIFPQDDGTISDESKNKIINSINPLKDVDGLTNENKVKLINKENEIKVSSAGTHATQNEESPIFAKRAIAKYGANIGICSCWKA